MLLTALLAVSLATRQDAAFEKLPWAPSFPGIPIAFADGHQIRIGNGVADLVFILDGRRFRLRTHSSWMDQDLDLAVVPFALVLRSGRRVEPSAMTVKSAPSVRKLEADPKSLVASERVPGRSVVQTFVDTSTGLEVRWRFLVRDGSNYVRQEFSITSVRRDVDVAKVELIDLDAANLPETRVVGTTPGSPMVVGHWFFGLEHPSSIAKIAARATASIERKIPIKKGQAVTYSTVIGAAPPGQLRRAFLRYLERERARPYQPFLHYNSWYDIGYFTKFDEGLCLDRIRAYGENLVRARGVRMDSFLFDDGWDDTATVWQFHDGFPKGFAPLKSAAAEFGAAPGVWLSPWGGYGIPRGKRLATGRMLGYEIDAQGYALSGPKYYARFREACLRMVTDYGINQFKLDGTGSPDKQYPGSAFASDFEAAIQLIKDLRSAQPKLFVNLTTGTWPSPFWTRYADSIWRGGYDHGFAGVGSNRQQWITYRDSDTYSGIVRKGPLYPLNSLMLHGIIFAQHANKLDTDPNDDFKSEVRSYFGSGTQLQEMYITPSLLNAARWDVLAQSAKWARDRADVLRDVHWIGGNPAALEVYGWAGWSGTRGVLTLRNPSDRTQAFSIDPAAVFELPTGSHGAIDLTSPCGGAARRFASPAGESAIIRLAPFEVVTLEGEIR